MTLWYFTFNCPFFQFRLNRYIINICKYSTFDEKSGDVKDTLLTLLSESNKVLSKNCVSIVLSELNKLLSENCVSLLSESIEEFADICAALSGDLNEFSAEDWTKLFAIFAS